MNAPDSIQAIFLEQVRKNLGPNLSFADELAELLNISRDSGYRRIRGETILSLDEVSILSQRFGVSVDAFLSPQADTVSFQLRAFDSSKFSFEKWLRAILGHLETFIAFPEAEKELVYNAKDLPIFHYFQFPRLSAFKMYFWMKSFANTKFNTGKYSDEIGKELISLGQKIWEKYASIPSTEIITYEMLNITLRQIEYAHGCGMFSDKHEARSLLEDCRMLTTHMKNQAAQGFKTTYGDETKGGSFEVYINDVLIGDNTVLFKLADKKRITFITPNNFNVLTTSNEIFCRLTEDNMDNLKSKSILISVTAEKERSKFFNFVEEKISEMEAKVL